MTDRQREGQILKTDALGRVRTSAERRERLLDEYEGSGVSGRKFAELTGIKYQTLASWVQRRRRHRGKEAKTKAPPNAAAVRWLEAVVEKSAQANLGVKATGLQVHLPGGVRLEIGSSEEVPLAAALLRAWEKAGTC
jgi:hypothetical protein